MPRKPNVTTMKMGRYASSAEAIPAPETPTASNRTGSQQQLDAMIAETIVPIFEISSTRFARRPSGWTNAVPLVATGNFAISLPQQSLAGTALWMGCSDICQLHFISI